MIFGTTLKIAFFVRRRDVSDPVQADRNHFRRVPFLRHGYWIGASARGGLSVHEIDIV